VGKSAGETTAQKGKLGQGAKATAAKVAKTKMNFIFLPLFCILYWTRGNNRQVVTNVVFITWLL